MYLNDIQLRSARCVLNLGVRDIGLLIQTSRTTISKLENNIIKLGSMRLADRRNTILQEFFKKSGVIFPNEHSITFSPLEASLIENQVLNNSLTRFQLRAARTILNKTQIELASLIKVLPSVIMYAENLPNESYIKPKNNAVITNLLNIFTKHGITFPDAFSVIFKN